METSRPFLLKEDRMGVMTEMNKERQEVLAMAERNLATATTTAERLGARLKKAKDNQIEAWIKLLEAKILG